MQDKIRQLVEEELARANEKFPPFHTVHEGWAVIKEEVEETEQDLDNVRAKLVALWDGIKKNHGNLPLKYRANSIETYSLSLIAEAIQVAAMARKFEQFLERSEENGEGKV